MESLSRSDRFLKAINAGVDQFGGVTDSSPILAIKDGRLPESRIDASAQRILIQKFRLGLFEQPYVDTDAVADIVGSESAVEQADRAQFKSLVLFQNEGLLPLSSGTRVWAPDVANEAIEAAGFEVAAAPENADVALVRTSAPYEQLHEGYFFGSRQHEGSLAFDSDNEDYQRITRLSEQLPVIVTVYMDRPAILTNIVSETSALLANFGVSDENLMSRLASDENYTATLPFALPRSMDQVEEQQLNVPNDIGAPLFALGFGLTE